MSIKEWVKSPESARNKPKLSPEQAQRISDEAISHGDVWDVQEKINARRFQAECGGGLGKLSAPVKLDAFVKPRCQAGEGAFGTYFVHPSKKYGVKLYRNGDEDDVSWEFDRLDQARAAGVNAPEPLSMNATTDEHGDVRAQTLVLGHMQGYQTIDSAYPDAYGNATNAPLIVQVHLAREFRKLHGAGLAHGDIHSGNMMVHPRSKKVALIDFGLATQLEDVNPHTGKEGIPNLLYDMRRLPRFLGFSEITTADFLERNKGVLDNIETQANNYNRQWEQYELAVNRYHDALERELLWDDRKPRSRFVRSIDQPRIPGLTRRILTANTNTFERRAMEHVHVHHLALFEEDAKKLGLKPPRLFLALKPERDARLARNRAQPFGTPL